MLMDFFRLLGPFFLEDVELIAPFLVLDDKQARVDILIVAMVASYQSIRVDYSCKTISRVLDPELDS